MSIVPGYRLPMYSIVDRVVLSQSVVAGLLDRCIEVAHH
jgi:hypothetical protein